VSEPIAIGFGGNVGTDDELVERFVSVRRALGGGVVASARLYRSAAIGPQQADFLNTAVLFEPVLAWPLAVLAELAAIEHRHGRRPGPRWGPRRLDLDVLVWGTRVIRLPQLEVPHPRLAERRFALLPIADLLGGAFRIPGGDAVDAALARTSDQRVELVRERW
jgi:2-amino-4-hydroxy-6-hydroxymethyldihydropteridine diphosphokinase